MSTKASCQGTPEHKILVCLGTTCYLRGSFDVLNAVKKELEIEPGEVTSDGKFALEVVRCLGACALGAVLMIDDILYPNVDASKVSQILSFYR
ncbi:MAG: NAD(P)H-dependent oxidoreductase subunit E [Desulfotomaculum sp.]|nr:NAD(P)H-dependent oxidoreductase subunit E [Desulfotomaculum sp.]